MDEELIYCNECRTHFLVQWEQDEDADNFLTPNYCPMCQCPITEDDYIDDDEDYE